MARARVIETDIESPPEADCLVGWPHPRETYAVLGHEAAEATLAEAIGSDRLHHA
jgi:DNA polymerase-3 subunit delta'